MKQVIRPGALGRPRGMGWGGRWERGSAWRTYVNPWLIHVNVWQKSLQYCKAISLQLIKNNSNNSSGIGASLVAQWETIHLSMQETWFHPWSGKIPHAVEQLSACNTAIDLCSSSQKLKLLSPCAAATETCAPQSLCPPASEATTVRSPHTTTRE